MPALFSLSLPWFHRCQNINMSVGTDTAGWTRMNTAGSLGGNPAVKEPVWMPSSPSPWYFSLYSTTSATCMNCYKQPNGRETAMGQVCKPKGPPLNDMFVEGEISPLWSSQATGAGTYLFCRQKTFSICCCQSIILVLWPAPEVSFF